MIGNRPTLKDIILEDVADLVDLTCQETLSQEAEQPMYPYKIAGLCATCEKRLCLYVGTTQTGIRKLQELLLDELKILCGPCGRNTFQYGPEQRI